MNKYIVTTSPIIENAMNTGYVYKVKSFRKKNTATCISKTLDRKDLPPDFSSNQLSPIEGKVYTIVYTIEFINVPIHVIIYD